MPRDIAGRAEAQIEPLPLGLLVNVQRDCALFLRDREGRVGSPAAQRAGEVVAIAGIGRAGRCRCREQ